MKNIWTYLDKKDWNSKKKYKAAFLIFDLLAALAGFALWLIVRPWILSTPDWMICFVGYSVIISWLVIFLYACRYHFHNGVYPSSGK